MTPGLPRRAARAGAAALLLVAAAGCRRAGPPPAAPTPRTLVRPAARVRGFDPVRAGDAASAMAYARIYEGLLQIDYLARPYRVVPLLAGEMPEVSADGRVHVFRIRRGIHFQNDPCFVETGGRGREVTAADFVYSLKRVADLKNASPGYWAFRDRIVGLDDFRRDSGGPGPTDYDRPVEGLRALDRHTLRIELTEPYPQFLYALTLHYAAVVPREAVAYYGEAFVNRPVGTGPFVLESWRRNYRRVYARNPRWAETGRVDRFPAGDGPEPHPAAGRPIPFLDRIVELVVADPATQWQMFLAGSLHLTGVSREVWDVVLDPGGRLRPELARRGIRAASGPAMDVFYIGFNMDDPVVGANRALRQALSAAFNREEWARFHHGRVRPAAGPVPPGAEGYVALEPAFPFDLDRARRLLAEAGYPEGIDPETGRRLQLTIEVADADNPELRQSTDLFVQFMDRIGVVVRPSFNNRPTFFEKVSRRQAQMFRLSWIADYPDAQNFLQLFHGPNASPGSNRANYVNPEYDRLYERFRILPPGEARDGLAERLVRIVQEDCPWIFVHHRLNLELVRGEVRHQVHHDFPFGMDKYLDVAPTGE